MTKMILPMGEVPGVVRESVREVLRARGFTIARAVGAKFAVPLEEAVLENALRELGNNTAQALWSIDQALNAPQLSTADALAAGQTMRALAASGTPNAHTAAVLARVGEWLVERALTEMKGAKAA